MINFDILELGVQKLANFLMLIAGFCLVLMMAHVGFDIALKLLLNKPLIGTLETVSYYYMVSVVFLPLAYIELRHEHVSVDLFFGMMSNKLKIIAYVFGGLLGISYLGIFAYQTTIDAIKASTEFETIMSNYLFYVWPSRWALPFGFLSFALAVLLNITKVLRTGVIEEAEAYTGNEL